MSQRASTVAKGSTTTTPWFAPWDESEGRWLSIKEMQSEEWIRKESEKHFDEWNHPVLWLIKEYELYNSAQFLWDSFLEHKVELPIHGKPHVVNFPTTALMLAAMSLECFLKAALYCQLPFPPTRHEAASISKGVHDLASLIAKVGWRNNESDRNTLNCLSHYLRWVGRYPLPKSATELAEARIGGVSQEQVWNGYISFRKKFGRRIPISLKQWARNKRRT